VVTVPELAGDEEFFSPDAAEPHGCGYALAYSFLISVVGCTVKQTHPGVDRVLDDFRGSFVVHFPQAKAVCLSLFQLISLSSVSLARSLA
jgi:hypothetical protein